MSLQADGGNHSGGHGGHGGHHGNGSGLSHSNQPAHHTSNLGDLSNDVMLGTYFEHWTFDNFIEGLRINMGTRFAVLFIAFTCWLYVIYWIRHHEPFSNQVIGIQPSLSPTTKQDQAMIAAIRNAFPLRTSPNMGQLYVPAPQPIGTAEDNSNSKNQSSTDQQNFDGKLNYCANNKKVSTGPGQALSSPIEYSLPNIDERFGLPSNPQVLAPISNNNPLLQSPNNVILSNTAVSVANQSPRSYQIRINNGQNSLLRTVVSR